MSGDTDIASFWEETLQSLFGRDLIGCAFFLVCRSGGISRYSDKEKGDPQGDRQLRYRSEFLPAGDSGERGQGMCCRRFVIIDYQ